MKMSELIFASFLLLFPVRFAHRMCGFAALPGSSLADVLPAYRSKLGYHDSPAGFPEPDFDNESLSFKSQYVKWIMAPNAGRGKTGAVGQKHGCTDKNKKPRKPLLYKAFRGGGTSRTRIYDLHDVNVAL